MHVRAALVRSEPSNTDRMACCGYQPRPVPLDSLSVRPLIGRWWLRQSPSITPDSTDFWHVGQVH